MTTDNNYFDDAMEVVLAHEGGYNSNPSDDGGITKFGISSLSYPKVDVANLTLEKAKAIYRADFWQPFPFNKIKDKEVAIKFFDLAVNMGQRVACRLVQRALRATDRRLIEDGVFGQKTLDAINNADSTDLLAALKSEAAGYYRLLVHIDTKDKIFLEGWLNRAYA